MNHMEEHAWSQFNLSRTRCIWRTCCRHGLTGTAIQRVLITELCVHTFCVIYILFYSRGGESRSEQVFEPDFCLRKNSFSYMPMPGHLLTDSATTSNGPIG
jgi:hypothetical protein